MGTYADRFASLVHCQSIARAGHDGLVPLPNGTFDQGGNVWEWNEAINGSGRSVRGGGFNTDPNYLAASYRSWVSPAYAYGNTGFRVAMIPEPCTALLVACGLVGLALKRRRG